MGTVGDNIKRLREEAKMTQSALAEKLAVRQPQLSDWEQNRFGIPKIQNLFKIAKVLNASLDDLLLGVDPEYDTARAERTSPVMPGTEDVLTGNRQSSSAAAGGSGVVSASDRRVESTSSSHAETGTRIIELAAKISELAGTLGDESGNHVSRTRRTPPDSGDHVSDGHSTPRRRRS